MTQPVPKRLSEVDKARVLDLLREAHLYELYEKLRAHFLAEDVGSARCASESSPRYSVQPLVELLSEIKKSVNATDDELTKRYILEGWRGKKVLPYGKIFGSPPRIAVGVEGAIAFSIALLSELPPLDMSRVPASYDSFYSIAPPGDIAARDVL